MGNDTASNLFALGLPLETWFPAASFPASFPPSQSQSQTNHDFTPLSSANPLGQPLPHLQLHHAPLPSWSSHANILASSSFQSVNSLPGAWRDPCFSTATSATDSVPMIANNTPASKWHHARNISTGDTTAPQPLLQPFKKEDSLSMSDIMFDFQLDCRQIPPPQNNQVTSPQPHNFFKSQFFQRARSISDSYTLSGSCPARENSFFDSQGPVSSGLGEMNRQKALAQLKLAPNSNGVSTRNSSIRNPPLPSQVQKLESMQLDSRKTATQFTGFLSNDKIGTTDDSFWLFPNDSPTISSSHVKLENFVSNGYGSMTKESFSSDSGPHQFQQLKTKPQLRIQMPSHTSPNSSGFSLSLFQGPTNSSAMAVPSASAPLPTPPPLMATQNYSNNGGKSDNSTLPQQLQKNAMIPAEFNNQTSTTTTTITGPPLFPVTLANSIPTTIVGAAPPGKKRRNIVGTTSATFPKSNIKSTAGRRKGTVMPSVAQLSGSNRNEVFYELSSRSEIDLEAFSRNNSDSELSNMFAALQAENDGSYMCSLDDCGQRFVDVDELRCHYGEFHNGLEKTTTVTAAAMVTLRKGTGRGSGSGSGGCGEKRFSCPELSCGKMFGRVHDLTRHSTVHSLVKRFSCESCSAMFSRRDALFRHKRTKKCGLSDTASPQDL
ncbi:hypothetical protein HK100_002252 [Physocladia obscura]|uniref:C2H2-type domain-containing protein n=1 Tax=Physocladia obscura TaxID=109957 RepID=A0AAD5XJJ2_9FUNG|nr:hypothetical protein HK100_002252 [Physocladia obscura]